jgi:mono/diheme cytochrome c family protein
MADSAVNRKSIPDIQEAVVYNDVIQPLLQSKCYHCHGKSRQKGGLRMDQPERLMKGGKDGEVILIHDPENSELVRRILLEREEETMPPKGRPCQLKENEIALIHWWISAGAPFDKRVKDLQQPEKIKPILLALQSAGDERMIEPDIPHQTVEKADESSVEELRKHGVVILPVAQNTNYLMANFVTAPKNGDSIVRLLSPLKKQLVWLKLGTSSITDSSLQIISLFTNLRRLQLDHTQITDKGLAELKNRRARYSNLGNQGYC